MDLMVVVPSHANGLIMESCAEKVRGRSPGTCLGIFQMRIAKHYVGSAAMVITREAVGKQAVRMVTVPVIVVAGVVVGYSDHFARRDHGTVRDTPSPTNSSANNE